MQNKGFVKLIAVLLTVICCFYLALTVKSRSFKGQVDEIEATQGKDAAQRYQDKVLEEEEFFFMPMKKVYSMGLGFGLDLEGGMNVIMEVGVDDVLKALSDHKENTDSEFKAAIDKASEAGKSGQDVIDVFIENYGKDKLAGAFATAQLRDKVKSSTPAEEVEKVLREEVKSSIENAFNILTNRVDQFGVAQPNIQRLEGAEGQIMVELPGVKDPEYVSRMLQSSANLEFWECYVGSEITAELNEIRELATGIEEEIKKEDKTFDKKLANLIVSTQLQHGCVVGSAVKYDIADYDKILSHPRIKSVLNASRIKLLWGVKAERETKKFNLYAIKVNPAYNGRAALEGDAISSAETTSHNNMPAVSMTMNSSGARKWADVTEKNVGRPIAIVLDDHVYSAPNVNERISGGNSQISGNFTLDETSDLVNVLKSGRMPAPARIISSEVVGPSMGEESINQGMWSCIIAFVILMLYMIMMYGIKPGMVANAALILNLFFTIGILSSFKAALTMSGIAGMVLSLGMAVDANVLIYERTKEELKAKKGTRDALAAGYSNAFSAIFDSNLTSIITGIILFNFGTGPIRGFATTLIIGIIVSFFTAVFVTRLVYENRMSKDKWLNLTFTTNIANKFFKNPAYKFMNMWKKSYIVFGALAVISIAFMLTRGFSKSIDFTGGRNFVVEFDKAVNPDGLRDELAKAFPESNTSVIALGTDGKKIRVSTNYLVEKDGLDIDDSIQSKLYTSLQTAKVLDAKISYEQFKSPDAKLEGVDNLNHITSSQKVGPSIAASITRGAVWSVILAFVAIFLYILVRFRNVAFSVGAITALILDIILILGMYAICWGWMPFSLEIDQTFIGAVLTAIGYSINDKVVVFDRIREFIKLHPKRDKKELFNTSLNTTLTRTINTSVSTFIVLAVIFCLGGDSIRSFAFAMILGVIFGTLSSIFIAAPTAYLTMRKNKDEKAAIKA